MNGAQRLLATLVDCGVDVCFANPGTSEMHFVAALDSVPKMRSVLGLFEGIVSGAADGYARMADKPAATLLHLGPGLTNALANIHNARKARAPMVNVVGDHATYHKQYDAPLTSDVEALALPLSHWTRVTRSADAIAVDAAEAVAAACAPPGRIATLILPADVSWSESTQTGAPPQRGAAAIQPSKISEDTVRRTATALGRGEKAVILMNGSALRERGLALAGRVAGACSARLMCDTFTGRLERGAGRTPIERLPYFPEMIATELQGVKHLVLVGAQAPVAFFAYPGKPNYLVPDGCEVHVLARPEDDAIDALERLCDALSARSAAATQQLVRPPAPQGALDVKTLAEAVAHCMPEGAIIADEGNTEGFLVQLFCAGAPAHDWLSNTGGSIGIGLPLATGAAIACPDRKVICLDGDGSAMYTFQALWTQARESLNVVNLILVNRSYRILSVELQRVGAEGAGDRARALFDIGHPDIDFVALSRAMGVPAVRVETADALTRELQRAMREPGPATIEVIMPRA